MAHRHVAIRADGGEDIGYGHLVRTSALIERLLEREFAVTVATTTPEPARQVYPTSVSVASLPRRGDPDPFCRWLDRADVDVVFSDAYPVDTAYQRAIRDRVPLIVFLDDTRHTICADVFVNGNLDAAALEYEFAADEPRTCLGTEYTLLRDRVRDLATRSPSWRDEPERALVTMGGTDLRGVTPTALAAFEGLDIRVDVIIGPGFADSLETEIRDEAAAIAVEIDIVRDPDDLLERMFQADFSVSTASSTTYELLALGTPMVSRIVADNQRQIANALGNRDLAFVLDRETGVSDFRRCVRRYMSDPELRRSRLKRGRSLVDGRGAERVADVVTDLAME